MDCPKCCFELLGFHLYVYPALVHALGHVEREAGPGARGAGARAPAGHAPVGARLGPRQARAQRPCGRRQVSYTCCVWDTG